MLHGSLHSRTDYERDQSDAVQRHRRPPLWEFSSTTSSSSATMGEKQHSFQQGHPPPPPPFWQGGNYYQPGNLVWWAGSVWKCEKPHTSGPFNREPTVTLNLWTPIGSSMLGAPGPVPAPSFAMAPVTSFVKRDVDPGQRRALMAAEAQEAWHARALQDELLGQRIWRVGGLGALAYTPEFELDQTRKAAWCEYLARNGENEPLWTDGCRRRAALMAQAGRAGEPLALVRWQWVETDGPIPVDAIPVGHEAAGQVLFAGRVYINGGIHLGKVGEHLSNRISVSWGGAERTHQGFEVLCGDFNLVRWVRVGKGQAASFPGQLPVEGGREKDGRGILAARIEHGGGVHPGKVQADAQHACLSFGGREVLVDEFEVAVYSDPDCR